MARAVARTKPWDSFSARFRYGSLADKRARSHHRARFSGVNAEGAVPCGRGKRCELRVAHVNQRRVVAALKIDLGLLFDTVIDNSIEAVAFANWRNGARHAVIE